MYILFVFPCSLLWCTLFFLSIHFSWRKSRNNIACFDFFEKSWKRQFCFTIFSMKNALTEKTKYTTTKSTEKRIKWPSLIFHFRNFVTEIFAKHFQKFSIFFHKIKKRQICCQNSRFCFMIFSMKNASTEKQSTPWWRTRKNHQDGHLHRKKHLAPASRWPKATSPPQELEIWERSDPNF